MSPRSSGMSTLEYHVLLSMAAGPLYGYAIKDAIEHESDGSVSPRAGSLYRVLGRMMASGLVTEEDPPADEAPHPGLTRKYYGLTPMGREALADQSQRLKQAALLAEKRLGLAKSNR
ncbi:MAG: PadR family transcriptional regulator [Longimicrobiales bacterium]